MENFEKIANVLSGTCSMQEKEEVEAWRKEAPVNEVEFCKLKKVWEAATHSAHFKPDVESAWKKVQTCLFQQEPETSIIKQQQSIPFYRNHWAIAAAVSLIILGSAGLLFLNRQQFVSFSEEGMAVIETNEDEQQALTLADGTQIWLNRNTRISYPTKFEGSTREVKLEGEAYFEVAHLPEKPFNIQAGTAKVQVMGTSFNLEAREQVKVQVTSGSVKFSTTEAGNHHSLLLTAGDAAYLEGNTIRQEKQDPNFRAWKTGTFVFEDTPLEEVLQALEKYYNVQLSAGSADILKCRLFARFEQQPIEKVLKVLSLTLNLKYHYEPGNKEIIFHALDQGQKCSSAVQ